MGHTASLAAPQLCFCIIKAATDNNNWIGVSMFQNTQFTKRAAL